MAQRKLPVFLILCMMMFMHSTPASAASGDKVTPVTKSDIEALIRNQQCPVVIVAMASWCSPCRKELPALNRLYEKYKGKGLSIIGISLDVGGPTAMQSIVDDMQITFPVYWGGEKMTAEYGISAVPLLMLSKNGAIVERIIGRRSEEFLEKKITALLRDCDG